MDALKIDKGMIISQLISIDPNIITLLMDAGMHCATCPSALGESLEEAAYVHGLDPDDIVEQINSYLAAK